MNPVTSFFYTLITGNVDCTRLSWVEKKALITKLLNTGRFSTITYLKKTTGLVVTRKAKLWVESYLASGDRNIVGINQAAQNDPDLFPYADITQKEFRSFSIRNLRTIKVDGNTYKFS